MKNKNVLIVTIISILLSFGGCVRAQPFQASAQKSVYNDSTYQFSFEPPNMGVDTVSSSMTVAAFYGPVRDNFARNVNVGIQNTTLTRAEFRAVTSSQFEEHDAHVTLDTLLTVDGHEAILWEYSASINGRVLQFLQLAVMAQPKVYLLTCTCLGTEFQQFEPGFRKSLMSFRLIR